MASKPGILTDWPWTPLGNFKYVVLAPWVLQSFYAFATKEESERDLSNFLILPLLLWRMIHNQIWISLSRYRTAKGNNRIVDKGIEFEQVDRERNWDDQILFNGIILYVLNKMLPGASRLPIWRTDGVILVALLHAGPVEFLYYWFHRALHHHFLYARYHSHHHSSIVTEPITSVIHPFAEHIVYYALFMIPTVTVVLNGTASLGGLIAYITYLDFMNNMGHCNFELVPKWLFSVFPPLKFLMYTPSFHSLHHTQFRTNYSLFMPFYDYIYGTMDKSSDSLYESSLKRQEETPEVVHLTHLTTPDSIYHLRFAFAYLASKPETSSWYLYFLRPLTLLSAVLTWLRSRTFVLERNRLENLRLQTWAIPKFTTQYALRLRNESINKLIENAIVEADRKGVKVLSLGLLNQDEELNAYGELYVRKHPELKTRVVDGSSLAVAVVRNSIPKTTTAVTLRGKLTKVAYALAMALCQGGTKVVTLRSDEHQKLKKSCGSEYDANLILATDDFPLIWLVGEGLAEREQMNARKGTVFIPFSCLPPKKLRKDCLYHATPAMLAPKSLENVDSCENWLPRRVMSVWRVGGIVHALEGWEEPECGYSLSNPEKALNAALRHGFQPLSVPQATNC